MGIVRMGIPQELAKTLVDEFPISTFVETGTYYGRTSEWAANLFEKVVTIENSKELYKQTVSKYKEVRNIDFLLGDSRTHLKDVVKGLSKPAMFWLDAHWSGDHTYGKNDQCPLLEEIEIINSCQSNTYILIDDARLFLSPPQPPHDIQQWPSLTEIVSVLQQASTSRYIVIIEDCIIAVPMHSKDLVAKYCQEVNAELWKEYGEALKTSDFRKGIDLIRESIHKRVRSVVRNLSKLSQATS